MKIAEAMTSNKPFKRPESDEVVQWYLGGTGPFSDLVVCDYFTVNGEFTTDLSLYASDILATDWQIIGTTEANEAEEE